MAGRSRVIRASARRGGDVDLALLGVFGALLAGGVVMVASASAPGGGLLARHLSALAVALGAGVMAFWVHTEFWRRAAPLLMLAALALLALVLAVGIDVNGSRRWLAVGALRVQPSELAKLCIVVFTAAFIARHRERLGNARVAAVPAAVLVAVAVLLLLEPDLGAALVAAGVVAALLLLGGVRMAHFAIGAAAAAVAAAVAAVAADYRLERLLAMLNPWSDPYGSGYQLVQAFIAFGRGELFGVGLGAGIQKLFYLPHATNDFLLAVVGEELGLAGTLTVMALFAVLLWRGFTIAARARDSGWFFESLLAAGMTLLLALQAVINIGVNLGLLPTKGLTLPLMSYGGSSLVVCCMAAGIILAVDRKTRGRA
ncbi:MAG: putative lipid II flippase FtsW [Gammaproteobacteria bacterium]|nr:putative lipid II flippase FtsW [Gammaproteobacteria bacterium]